MIHDEKEMCNLCNRYFHSSFTRPTPGEELPDMECLCNENIRDITVTPEIVRGKIGKPK